jgi:hypothetical protein
MATVNATVGKTEATRAGATITDATRANLLSAFVTETVASRRYLACAVRPQAEGHSQATACSAP